MITVRISKSKEMNGEQSLFVSFPYDNKIVSVIRGFSSRYWDKENKEWELPLKSLGKLTEKLNDYEFEITGFYQPEEKKAFSIPSNFKFKTQPFEHQIDGFQFGLENDRWLLGDEQGLGKTKQVIDIAVAKKLERGYKHCLIICGVNGLKWNWQNEIETHSDETGWILGQRLKAGKWKIGSNKDKLADLNALESLNSYFLITNVETLRVTEISAKLAELCKDKTIGIVAIDEIHKCFDYNTLISTDLGELKIGDIVTNKIKCNVISYNENAKVFEYKPITDYFENAIFDEMLELDIETSNGIRTIKCTKNHLFYTSNRGWVKADNLTPSDDIVEY